MATYSVRFTRGGSALVGAQIVAVGERYYGTTNGSGVISVDLGTYASPLGVHFHVSIGGAPAYGGGPHRIEPNSTLEIAL